MVSPPEPVATVKLVDVPALDPEIVTTAAALDADIAKLVVLSPSLVLIA